MAEPRTPRSPDRAALPPQVRRAAERADQLQEEFVGGQQPPAEPTPPNGNGQQPPAPVEGIPPQPAPPQPAPPQLEPEETWQQRYEREHGRLVKAREDIVAMGERMSQLEQALVSMRATGGGQPPAPQDYTPQLSTQEEEEWGEAIKIIDKYMGPRFKELQDKVAQIGQRVEGVGEVHKQDARSRMLQTLDTNPFFGLGAGANSWRMLNDDPDFVDVWLKRIDRYSGRLRHDMLKEAYNSNDAGRMSAFFEDFLKESGRLATPSQPPGNGAYPYPQGSAPAHTAEALLPGMERWASPGRPRAAPVAPTTPAEPEWFTSGDIDRFYGDKTAGRWRGREAEADAYELSLFQALKAGRVRPGPPQP